MWYFNQLLIVDMILFFFVLLLKVKLTEIVSFQTHDLKKSIVLPNYTFKCMLCYIHTIGFSVLIPVHASMPENAYYVISQTN